MLDVLPGCGGQGIRAEISITDCAAYGDLPKFETEPLVQ
jgi:hypothetical protein